MPQRQNAGSPAPEAASRQGRKFRCGHNLREVDMTHLDLFSGIGGFAIAAQKNGFKTIGFCEREPYAQQILIEKFNGVLADPMRPVEWRNQRQEKTPIHANIFQLNGANYAGVTLVTGGFPCQPFSVAGKRLGKADDRAIWPEMLRVIDEARPAWVIGENVAGIINMELDRVLFDLESIGYSARPFVIPACAVDARHRRDRVWIIAYRGCDGLQGRQKARSYETIGKESKNQFTARLHGGRDGTGTRQALWQPEPAICRMAHGIPNRSHRLKGLGNAIVPQVAEEIIRAIATLTPPPATNPD
jgi:DNA (cytosine-5)-methyltransferase 1